MAAFDLANEVAIKLSANGFGDLYSGASPKVFAGLEPASPNEVITVLSSVGGRTVGRLGEDHIFEVRVRSASYQTAMTSARAIWTFLTESGTGGQGSYGGILVARLTSNAPAVSLGRDEGPAGGLWRTSQAFTALIKAASFT